MAHKALVGGTAYNITGGKSMVSGTVYNIAKGRTLIDGTGYNINFVPPTYIYALLYNSGDFAFQNNENIEDGKKSMAYTLSYLNPTATMVEEEVSKAYDKVTNALVEEYQVVVR